MSVIVGGEPVAVFLFGQIYGAGPDLRTAARWFDIKG
jgi:hypothetical protein